MRTETKYIFIFLILIISNIKGQTIDFTVYTIIPDCHGGQNGEIKTTVIQTYPPYTYLWNTGDTTDMIINLGLGIYFVTITDGLGNDTVVSIKLRENQCEITATMIFTPNNDGYNDTWLINNLNYFPENKILVYNRWGQKVYEHKGEYDEPWDGKDMFGVPVPDNTYYYYIVYNFKDSENLIVKGNVSIIR